MFENISELEEKIGYVFKDKSLIKQALTHSSFVNEQKINKTECYERIEFLGDAVLELVSSDFFYRENPNTSEGDLTKMRAAAVCEQALDIAAKDLNLGEYMVFGRGEKQNGGSVRASIIADCVEAVIGAIYLDSSIKEATDFIMKFVLNDLDNKRLFYDAKSILQEKAQENKNVSLIYELVGEEGPEHDKNFTYKVLLDSKEIGIGTGKNKKSAQQNAAYDALLKIQEQSCI